MKFSFIVKYASSAHLCQALEGVYHPIRKTISSLALLPYSLQPIPRKGERLDASLGGDDTKQRAGSLLFLNEDPLRRLTHTFVKTGRYASGEENGEDMCQTLSVLPYGCRDEGWLHSQFISSRAFTERAKEQFLGR